MFDHEDVAQEVAILRLTGVRVNRNLVRRRLARAEAGRGCVKVRRASQKTLNSAEARSDARDVVVDLEGLPERTLEVARLLAAGYRFGDVEVALGIGRKELDAEREVLKAVLW